MKILTNKQRLIIIDFIDRYDYYCKAPVVKNILGFFIPRVYIYDKHCDVKQVDSKKLVVSHPSKQ